MSLYASALDKTFQRTLHINFLEHEFACKVAKNVGQAKKLVEAGFEFITDYEGYKLFRKRK